jgi:hypothetical protein
VSVRVVISHEVQDELVLEQRLEAASTTVNLLGMAFTAAVSTGVSTRNPHDLSTIRQGRSHGGHAAGCSVSPGEQLDVRQGCRRHLALLRRRRIIGPP